MKELAYKICIFGESCVGKTTLARRYLTGYFEEDIKLTYLLKIIPLNLQLLYSLKLKIQTYELVLIDYFSA
ncbi:hypothetical protein LCGC14_1412460 [marine sediment metagenome]|uniref:Uncharacterized protein n=1 Tax=marine sediment metagenome TaxID=412755 RepID=A0A0F9KEV6_9ZZZZ